MVSDLSFHLRWYITWYDSWVGFGHFGRIRFLKTCAKSDKCTFEFPTDEEKIKQLESIGFLVGTADAHGSASDCLSDAILELLVHASMIKREVLGSAAQICAGARAHLWLTENLQPRIEERITVPCCVARL